MKPFKRRLLSFREWCERFYEQGKRIPEEYKRRRVSERSASEFAESEKSRATRDK